MIKSKFTKAFILGMCITVLSSTAAFADTGAGQPAVAQNQQTGIESSLLEKQKEIDQFVFEKHAREIAGKGFTVTNTGVVGKYVEIGIIPFNEVNADFLYKTFGSDVVKVVEGQQAVLMTASAASPDTAVSSMAIATQPVNEKMLEKQREIDQYLFEQHKDEIAKKDFKVTHTAPFDNYVEIGITPYNEANAEFLYKIFGKDSMKVVEGQLAVTMELKTGNNAAEAYTVTASADTKVTSGMASPTIIALLCAAGTVIFGGAFIATRRRRTVNR